MRSIVNITDTDKSAVTPTMTREPGGAADARQPGLFIGNVTSKRIWGSLLAGPWQSYLPYIDTALREVTHLTHQNNKPRSATGATEHAASQGYNLTRREVKVLRWVAMDKTNSEIASVLKISSFTVKNHMQRLFKKLDGTNWAQAVSQLMPLVNNVQA